jgi:hypothetical protein
MNKLKKTILTGAMAVGLGAAPMGEAAGQGINTGYINFELNLSTGAKTTLITPGKLNPYVKFNVNERPSQIYPESFRYKDTTGRDREVDYCYSISRPEYEIGGGIEYGKGKDKLVIGATATVPMRCVEYVESFPSPDAIINRYYAEIGYKHEGKLFKKSTISPFINASAGSVNVKVADQPHLQTRNAFLGLSTGIEADINITKQIKSNIRLKVFRSINRNIEASAHLGLHYKPAIKSKDRWHEQPKKKKENNWLKPLVRDFFGLD